MQIKDRLEQLKTSGAIHSWKIINLDDEGNEGKSANRNTEKLIIEFLNGDRLEVGTFCSGSAEDTSFI